MAVRLSKAFEGTSATRLELQLAHDLAQAHQHEDEIQVQRYEPQAVSTR